MSRLWTCGFEQNNIAAGVEITGYFDNPPTIESSIVRSGARSMKCDFLEDVYFQFDPAGRSVIFARAFFMFTELPVNNRAAILDFYTSDNTRILTVKLETNGTLTCRDFLGLFTLTSSTVSANQWFMVEASIDTTTPTATSYTVRLNETQFGNTTVNESGAAGDIRPNKVAVGYDINGGDVDNGIIYVDDIAVNDNSANNHNSWPGLPNQVEGIPNDYRRVTVGNGMSRSESAT